MILSIIAGQCSNGLYLEVGLDQFETRIKYIIPLFTLIISLYIYKTCGQFAFHFEQKTGEVSLLLRRAREEEKMLRKSFVNVCGQHFLLTLFPELQDRVPDITVSVGTNGGINLLIYSQICVSTHFAFAFCSNNFFQFQPPDLPMLMLLNQMC